MRVVGKVRLVEAIEAGNLPAVAACAWFAEAVEAQWAVTDDILKAYDGAEELDDSRILVPLDNTGHCVVILVEYRCASVLVVYAGQRGGYRMGNRRVSGRS